MRKIKALALTVQKLLARLRVFEKNGSNSKVKVTGSKYWYPRKGLITGNIHVKYQSSITRCLKIISKVKISKNWSNSNVKVTGLK